MGTDAVLVLNAGSSSLKFAIFDADSLKDIVNGVIEGIGGAVAFSAKGNRADAFEGMAPPSKANDHQGLIAWLLETISTGLADVNIVAAGHRVVHGGQDFDRPTRLTSQSIEKITALTPLAPSHQPHNLAAIHAVASHWPHVPQAAAFDTAFHRTQPRLNQLFALPRTLSDEGVIRYGFHGMSYDYIASVLDDYTDEKTANGRVVVAHLGHGASMCGLLNRKSHLTTMGFTALDGLMMGKRCGAIDPGVLLYLAEQKGLSPAEISRLLYHESGLKGVSGVSSDMRDVLATDTDAAREAVDLFASYINRQLGSLTASLGGLDALVFTAGIGTYSAPVREKVCNLAHWTGLELDEKANENNEAVISTARSPVKALVIPTNEELVIARAAVSQCL